MSDQYHFDFKDWVAAFQEFYDKHIVTVLLPDNPDDQVACILGDRDYCLVISEAPYVSGYWVEQCARPDEHTSVYETMDQVVALHRRVIKARESTNAAALGGIVQ